MSKRAQVNIGTSGWSYGDWGGGIFYPDELSEKEWLEYYAKYFSSVELNASFYHLPSAKTFTNWRLRTPKDFIVSVKISRYLTHIKKLNDPREPWQRFINNARALKEKLGPILVQLPPNLKVNGKNLDAFLNLVPKNYKIALEVRHKSWLNKEIYAILNKHKTCLVFTYGEGLPIKEEITTNWLYLRLHGPEGLYGSKYTKVQLKKFTKKIKNWQKEVKEIYVYFNNDTSGYAIVNAKALKKLI
jgi:uncharacterized protein YecE (DUF72 family)